MGDTISIPINEHLGFVAGMRGSLFDCLLLVRNFSRLFVGLNGRLSGCIDRWLCQGGRLSIQRFEGFIAHGVHQGGERDKGFG